MSSRVRTALVAAVGVVVLYFAADRLVSSPAFPVPPDFAQYWSAGAVNLRGGNPYDAEQILAWQKLADPARTEAVMMWNPPWSLAAYMPLGLLPVRWAALLWVGLQLAAVMLGCDLLWRAFDGPARLRWVAQVVGLSSVGTWWTVSFGQNAGLLLLGLAGFAFHTKRDRPAVAGAFAALTALKPHLLAVFGVILVLDAVTRRGRVALASGATVLAVSLGLALAANPEVVSQYREAVRNPGPGAVPLDGWMLPAASYWLRVKLAPERFWVQFVPCAMACLGFAVYRLRRGSRWDWLSELPVVVWVSVLATAYGGWIFDLPVLLVPMVWAAVRAVRAGSRAALAALIGGQLAVLAASLAWTFGLHEFWWVAPAMLGVYLTVIGLSRPHPARFLP